MILYYPHSNKYVSVRLFPSSPSFLIAPPFGFSPPLLIYVST